MSDDGILDADVAIYGQAAAADSGPPAIASDPLVEGGTPIEQLLRALGLAANSGDPLDDAAGLGDYADRGEAMNGAAEGFASQDGSAGSEMSQLPQLATGIAGALAGAIAGALAPVMQVPAQFAQGAGQALQAGTALVGQYRGEDPTTLSGQDYPDFPSAEESVAGAGAADDPTDDLSAVSGVQADAGVGATTPMALLGPAPVPSATTAPASATPLLPPPPSTAPGPAVGTAGMAGMPMIPPGPMSPAADRAAPPETKRVAAPAVRNGAPVQGRITGPPAPRTLEGRPVEARRIVMSSASDEAEARR